MPCAAARQGARLRPHVPVPPTQTQAHDAFPDRHGACRQAQSPPDSAPRDRPRHSPATRTLLGGPEPARPQHPSCTAGVARWAQRENALAEPDPPPRSLRPRSPVLLRPVPRCWPYPCSFCPEPSLEVPDLPRPSAPGCRFPPLTEERQASCFSSEPTTRFWPDANVAESRCFCLTLMKTRLPGGNCCLSAGHGHSALRGTSPPPPTSPSSPQGRGVVLTIMKVKAWRRHHRLPSLPGLPGRTLPSAANHLPPIKAQLCPLNSPRRCDLQGDGIFSPKT